jgi:hypothetical protein
MTPDVWLPTLFVNLPIGLFIAWQVWQMNSRLATHEQKLRDHERRITNLEH